jgi:hypothetical protein
MNLKLSFGICIDVCVFENGRLYKRSKNMLQRYKKRLWQPRVLIVFLLVLYVF